MSASWLTITEAAVEVDETAATVRRLADSGDLEGYRLDGAGNPLLISRDSVDAWRQRARGALTGEALAAADWYATTPQPDADPDADPEPDPEPAAAVAEPDPEPDGEPVVVMVGLAEAA